MSPRGRDATVELLVGGEDLAAIHLLARTIIDLSAQGSPVEQYALELARLVATCLAE